MTIGCKLPFPRIEPAFEIGLEDSNSYRYVEILRNTLAKLIPDDILSEERGSPTPSDKLQAFLPYVTYTTSYPLSNNCCFYAISRNRINVFNFFFEMISRWLVPGKRLNVLSVYAVDYRLPDLSEDCYTFCEIVLQIESPEDFAKIEENFPVIEQEIRLGMDSSYYARRILELKGISPDEKTAFIHQYIAYLAKRLPKVFDLDITTEMQHVLVFCRDDFKSARTCHHLSKIISYFYLFRKAIRNTVKAQPGKRHVSLKLFRSQTNHANEVQNVLSIIVGVNLLSNKEIFEKRHLLKAVRSHIPDAVAVEGSYFSYRRGVELISTMYLEVIKPSGQTFTTSEISNLRKLLTLDIKDQVEVSINPVFMPRNEEEIMRNIVLLGNQLKYTRDIPQLIISFDEQSPQDLFFNIILVRLVAPCQLSIKQLFEKSGTFLQFIHDRCKNLGYLRKKHLKEATVFRVSLPAEPFLRKDHSIDLYKARYTVVEELANIIGDFRDYNGGMILKQNELLNNLKESLTRKSSRRDHLVENFFFSLSPPVMQTVLELEALTTLFNMHSDSIESANSSQADFSYKILKTSDFVFFVIKGAAPTLKEEILKQTHHLHLSPYELVTSFIRVHEIPYLGVIYRSDDQGKQQVLTQTLENVLEKEALQLDF